MFIENPEDLKIWLTSYLGPLCDADPAALAKYVMALVKKDKPEEDLKAVCLDQLDVFLQKETASFVSTLFEALHSKKYITPSAKPAVTAVATKNDSTIHAQLTSVTAEKKLSVVNAAANVSSQKTDVKKHDKYPENSLERELRNRKSRSSSPINKPRSKSASRSRSPISRNRRSRSREDRRPINRYDDYNRRRGRGRRYGNRSYGDYRRDRDKDVQINRDRNRSWSRSRSKSSSPKPKEKRVNDTAEDGNSLPHGDVDYRVPPIVISADDGATSKKIVRRNKRCRDYDEKGFCMRGDLCQYDHGTDPVVVEDVNLPTVLGFHPPTAASVNRNPPLPGASSSPRHPPPLPGMITPLPDTSQPPPTIIKRPPVEHFPPEPYNPEAPGIRIRHPYWSKNTPGCPPLQPNSTVRGPRPPRPMPQYFPQQNRTLIGVPTVEDVAENNDSNSNATTMPIISSQVTVPAQQTEDKEKASNESVENNKSSSHSNQRNSSTDSNLGKRKLRQYDNCTLSITKIPHGLNTITQLNNHFAKFGNIVNLQICYEGNPEAALITFSSNAEAHAAYRSTEAVLNNRFIKVFWHNQDKSLSSANNNNEFNDASVAIKMSIKDRLGIHKLDNTKNNAKSTVENKNKWTNSVSADAVADQNKTVFSKAVVYCGGGNLSKTVYNVAALKKVSNLADNASTTVADNRNKADDQRKETLKKKVDLQKRKQELLENQIQQQKLLIDKLEKNKNLSTEDKSAIMKTILLLTKSIESTRKEIKDAQMLSANSPQQPKTKQDAQKEILDAELELYNKQHSGADTSELLHKVIELKSEAAALGLIGRGGISYTRRGRGRGMRGYANRLNSNPLSWGSHQINRMNVDRRPKKLLVKSVDGSKLDKSLITNHFSQLAQVEDSNELDDKVVVTFKTRKDAELAANFGSKFKDKSLILTWYKAVAMPTSLRNDVKSASFSNVTNIDEDEVLEDDEVLAEDELLDEAEEDLVLGGGEEEEEEEDSEARSWRR